MSEKGRNNEDLSFLEFSSGLEKLLKGFKAIAWFKYLSLGGQIPFVVALTILKNPRRVFVCSMGCTGSVGKLTVLNVMDNLSTKYS